MNHLWDSEGVQQQIGRLHRLGEDLSYTGVWHEHPELLFAAIHYFGNWGRAVTACGLDYDKIRRVQVWNRRRIECELRQWRRKRVDLSYNRFERRQPKLFHAAVYHYGSWKRALAAIGVDYRKVRRPEPWSREKVVRRIKQLKRRGVDLSHNAMFAQGHGVAVSMGNYYYGGWPQAIRKAGLDYKQIRKKPGPLPGSKRQASDRADPPVVKTACGKEVQRVY